MPDEPVRITDTLDARSRLPAAPGEYVYDLGQNMVGVSRVRLTGKAGQTVTIRYAEELFREGDKRGTIYTANFRTAKVLDSFTFAKDGEVVYQPTFTQHGFRYVQITGVDSPPGLKDVQGVVLGSDLPGHGELRLSDSMLDQLVRNIRWGQRSNFVSFPTDTPARDERLGWTGDISVFAPTAGRFVDSRAFLSKWMDDVRDASWNALVPQIRKAFVSAYARPDGSLYMRTQTVYALALGMGLIEDPKQRGLTADKFVQKRLECESPFQSRVFLRVWLWKSTRSPSFATQVNPWGAIKIVKTRPCGAVVL